MAIYTVISQQTDPYYNLALEEALLHRIPEDSIILYLWQNAHTVVIGRNQNPWTECRTALLHDEGGHLARRLSGGGAVYHDLGNLNFTFLCHQHQYDLKKQLSVIQKAVGYAGIQAEFSGRNDLLAEGKKFSGNAFYNSKGLSYHHGTLLINSDLDKLQRYLSPPKAKLESKGIASVRSRVINLSVLSPALSCSAMMDYMVQAFGKIYGDVPMAMTMPEETAILALRSHYAGSDWLWGKVIPFSCTLEGSLPWGNLQICLLIKDGQIETARVYTDAMEHTLADEITKALTNCPFQTKAMIQALADFKNAPELTAFIQNQQL